MKKFKKWIVALIVILIPAIGFGFNYFRWQGDQSVSKQTLTVKGGITVQEVSEYEKLVPGDKICNSIGFNIESTAPSFLRVKVETFYKDDGSNLTTEDTKADIGTIVGLKDNWVDGNDGYYYYTKAVDQDTQGTEALLFADSIKFEVKDDDDANEYQDKYIHAKVTAEMVQAKYDAFKTAWNVTSDHPAYTDLNAESERITQ
ncbi:MAG: hypothetical protein ACI4PU_04575 [Intestinibacter sp.]